MVNIVITDSLKKYMDSRKSKDILLKPLDPGGCCTGGVEIVSAEAVTNEALLTKLPDSNYIMAEQDAIRLWFSPELRYSGETLTFDYGGRLFKEIQAKGVYVPSVFSDAGSGRSIRNLFFE